MQWRRYLPMTATQMGLVAGLAVLTIGACLPIWTVWYLNDWEGLGEAGPVWRAAAQVSNNLRFGDYSELARLHETNLLTAVVLYLLAWIIGLAVFFVARRKGR